MAVSPTADRAGPDRGGAAISCPHPAEIAAIGILAPALAAKICTELAPLLPPHM